MPRRPVAAGGLAASGQYGFTANRQPAGALSPDGVPTIPVPGPLPVRAATARYGPEPETAEHPDPDLDATQHLDSVGLQDDAAAARKKKQQSSQKRFWRELVTIVVAAAVLTLLVKAFVVQVYRIPSGSMENTLLVGDRVLVNKLVYDFRPIGRGDVVVFSGKGSWDSPAPPAPPGNPLVRGFDTVLSWVGLHSNSTFYIKRVIGVPGDKIACCTPKGKVTVNGVPLSEDGYVLPGSTEDPFPPVTVPPGRLWVMGDNRDNSEDSRGHRQLGAPDQGTIPENQVVGRAFFKIWPVSQFGDLPIPSTFQQAALHASTAGAAVLRTGQVGAEALGVIAAVPLAGTVGAAGAISTPFLLRRHRKFRGRAVL